MARLISIDEHVLSDFSKSKNPEQFCKELESGNILFFPSCPFPFPEEERAFLLEQKQSGATNRKNIAYKPKANKMTNIVGMTPDQEKKLLEIMQRYCQNVVSFLSELLPPYADRWQLDYGSFRPFQEKGRDLRTRARNDLLHCDSFPTRPLHGRRILRFFTNINPTENRVWNTSLPFNELAQQFGGKEVSFPKKNSAFFNGIKKLGHSLGLPVTLRSPYDVFMLNLHNFLKENSDFQQNCHKDNWKFPPHSCWAVFTDQVSHAALSGQYALEQTILVPPSALVDPEKAPVNVLEKLTGQPMIESAFTR